MTCRDCSGPAFVAERTATQLPMHLGQTLDSAGGDADAAADAVTDPVVQTNAHSSAHIGAYHWKAWPAADSSSEGAADMMQCLDMQRDTNSDYS